MIACWWLIGGGAGPEQPGRLGWDVVKDGFLPLAVLARQIGDVLAACGSRKRIFLHNPFGLWDTPGRNAQMSLHAERYAERDDRLDYAVETFKPAWAPLIKDGFEIVDYRGFDELADPGRRPKASTWFNAIHETLNRSLSTGCSIALDSVASWSVNDSTRPEPRLALLLQSLNVVTYVEGPPRAEWSNTPVIIDATSSDAWRGTLGARSAETIVRVRPDIPLAGQLVQAAEVLKHGYTAAIDAVTLLNDGAAVKAAFGS